MTVTDQAEPETVGTIPVPSGEREVVKLNIFERAISLNSQLAPVFPYFGPGELVANACLLRGQPEEEYGQFFHENSQEEVAIAFGSNLAMLPVGALLVSPKIHGVNSFLKESHNPEAFLLLVIIQRQIEADAAPEEQYEAAHIRCSECNDLLLRHVFSADPLKPHEHGGRADDRYQSFATIHGTLTATQLFNDDEEMRTCGKCGHVNVPFPHDTWGWHDWVTQQRTVNEARRQLLAAVGDRLSPATEV
jgi:hypothetical protein